MSFPFIVVPIIQVISALTIIVLVLLQQGKGADMGSAFGTGSAGSLFGASGAANFLSRATKWAAVVFFISTASLAWLGHRSANAPAAETGVMQNFQPQDRSVPQAPGAAGSRPAPAPAAAPASAPATGASVPMPTLSPADASVPAGATAPADAPAPAK